MKNKAPIILLTVILASACSSYKPLEDGVFKVGYQETKLVDGGYQLTYYGSDRDDEEDVKNFWHRRARELCYPATYETTKAHAGEWKSDGVVILPPVLVAAENANATYSGEVHCKAD